MGKPSFSRKKYDTPSHPWQEDRIKAENELIKKYGLKNKREIWKAETVLRKYRGQARVLLARIGGGDPQTKKESDQLLMYLTKLNVLPAKSTLDDVLALDTESILSRRLQTLTYLKGLANTPMHARQLISHGHIAIGGRKITVPGYMVVKDEEGDIGYLADSPLNDVLHPSRPHADFKSAPVKKDKKPEEPKEEKPPVEKPAEKEGEPEKEEEVKPVDEKKPVKEEKPSEASPQEEATSAEETPKVKSAEQPKEETDKKPREQVEKPDEADESKEEKTEDKPEDVKKEGGK